jgi:hypothetical protein
VAAARHFPRPPRPRRGSPRNLIFDNLKPKTLADYDFAFPMRVPKTASVRLFDCDFIPRHGCAVVIGPTGTGKPQPA